MNDKFSILLVDDDPTVIRIFSRILCGFTPLRFATTGRTALKLARESAPDLVLLDVEMPDLSGFEICKAFKKDALLAAVPIIFITGHDSPQLAAIGLQLGAADFIGKPPSASLLLARVKTYQQLKQLSDTVRSAVTMDFLTGALTRRRFEKAVSQDWLRTQRAERPLALLLADIDDFAALNARAGEEAGDGCLRAVADALRSITRRSDDVLGRYAGGQFALFLPDTTRQAAEAVARRAVEAVAQLQEFRVTLTVGIGYQDGDQDTSSPATSSRLADPATPDRLFAAAQMALRDARASTGPRLQSQSIYADADSLVKHA